MQVSKQESSKDYMDKFAGTSILKIAVKTALTSDYFQKIGAVIFKGNKIVSYACNEIRGNKVPKWLNYHECSLHAEASAILKVNKRSNNMSILVVRINSNGILKLSKPCEKCEEFIKFFGHIKNVYYSTNEGTIERMRL